MAYIKMDANDRASIGFATGKSIKKENSKFKVYYFAVKVKFSIMFEL